MVDNYRGDEWYSVCCVHIVYNTSSLDEVFDEIAHFFHRIEACLNLALVRVILWSCVRPIVRYFALEGFS